MTLSWLFRLRPLPEARLHSRNRRPRRGVVPYVEQVEDRCVPSTLTVDGSQQFQTIDGFGTNLSSEAWNSGAVVPSLDTLLGHGYKLFRVILEPVQGWEDSNPNTGQYSDSNPNWPFYNNLYGTSTKFTNLWNTINYLNNHGGTVWLNLQSDAPAWMTDSGGGTGTIGQDHETDWATMVSTMVDYAINTAQVHIAALGPMNEPDNSGDPVQGPQVHATQYVRMLDTLETQLQGYGLGNIPLAGPDNADTSVAISSYVPAMLADSFLMPHVLQFGFHTYGGTTATDSAITNNSTYPGRQIISDEYDGPYYNEDHAQRATPDQLWTQADGSFQNLMAIVGAGENGAVIWDGVDNFYEYYQQWSAHGLISYDWTAPDPTAQSDYGTTPRLYANAQMFQFVATGSVVIGSSNNAGNFIELAFKNPSGQITIVGENTGSSAQSITGTLTGGLNVSLFNMYFTNSSIDEQQQANVAVTNNAFSFTVPADTIFTLTTPTAPSITGVTPIAGLTSGGQSVIITGSGFSGATGVSFGGVAASSFTINSDTTITALTPAQGVGTVDVTVANSGGSSATVTADQFQYVVVNGTAPPTVANPASATLAGNQSSASLSVLGASQYAASTLTYTWSTTGTPPAPVTLSTNGNNSASNVTATFSQAGSYSFQVTITDPAGNSVISNVGVTVNQVATKLAVSPASGAVVTGGTLQFSDTASDQFGNPYSAPVSWTVSGGGTIDNTGKFTAGSVTGGPFMGTASAGGLNATASVTIYSNVNLARSGTAYRWFGLSSTTSNANQTAAPALNDNNLATTVVLTGGGDDVANAYEAAGVIWSTSQSVNTINFINGSFNSSTYDGVFDNNFGLQTTTDGTTWTNVSGWSLSPAYQYNLPAAAGVTYTFTGSALSVLGFRVVGQVHSLAGKDSWYDDANEVQAFGVGTSNPPPTVTGLNPGSGGIAGGISVTITGSNFTGAAEVWFGSVAASSFTVNSATQIAAVAPAAPAAGGVDVTVTTSYGTSATSAADQFIYVTGTTTSVVSSVNPSAFGQTVVFTAKVSPLVGSKTPGGTVTFMDGSNTLGTGTLSGGTTTYTTSALAVGSHSITAAYSGDASDAASTSQSLSQHVNQANTTTTLASTVASVFGQSVTFTATVSVNSPGAGTPASGTVTFFNGANQLGTGTVSGGMATYSTSSLSVGSHTITASYGGDGVDFAASPASSAITQTVNKASTTTAIASSVNPSVSGQSVALTATVTANSPGSGTPPGTVTFKVNGTSEPAVKLNSKGQAVFTFSPTVGTYNVTATYNGGANFTFSISPILHQVVNKDASTVAVVSSLNPSTSGRAVTFTATISAAAPGWGTPTGTVQFLLGSTLLGSATLSGGQASFTISTLPVGSDQITVQYKGDSHFTASSGSITQTVNASAAVEALLASLDSPLDPKHHLYKLFGAW